MNYLEYIELAPENLQFFLWFRDYASRFEQSQSQSRNPFTTPPPTAQSEGPNPPPTDYKYETTTARSFDADDEQPINLPVPVPVKSPITPEVGSIAPWEMDPEKDASLTKVHSSVQASYRAIAHRTFTEAGLEIPRKLSCLALHRLMSILSSYRHFHHGLLLFSPHYYSIPSLSHLNSFYITPFT
jgi:hypothetical protein